jgi:hypothetical protein
MAKKRGTKNSDFRLFQMQVNAARALEPLSYEIDVSCLVSAVTVLSPNGIIVVTCRVFVRQKSAEFSLVHAGWNV